MPSRNHGNRAGTAERTLDVAERLVQVRGFNGFSYADVATELGVTKATLHYHFPGKAELGEALIARYRARFADALQGIDREIVNTRAKLDAYLGLYSAVLRGDRMCLCGILAAEYETLPSSMRQAIIEFFEDNEAWLATVVTHGQADGSVTGSVDPAHVAQMILDGLEGAMLVARTHGGLTRFQSSAGQLLDTLTV
jgi:TetR/AcrR family transcriptional regulator, transcriptional repressor for nem operon